MDRDTPRRSLRVAPPGGPAASAPRGEEPPPGEPLLRVTIPGDLDRYLRHEDGCTVAATAGLRGVEVTVTRRLEDADEPLS